MCCNLYAKFHMMHIVHVTVKISVLFIRIPSVCVLSMLNTLSQCNVFIVINVYHCFIKNKLDHYEFQLTVY